MAQQLAKVFCDDPSPHKILTGMDLSPPVDLHGAFVELQCTEGDGYCSQSCEDIYAMMINKCQINSRTLTGRGEFSTGCGTYVYQMDAREPTNIPSRL
ncbi:MAG: hypothetical protein M1817_002918 [Caeruleum heppii]|nr:MAG: hypothetical protein M1817_002918 [Caeruleum heppii]